MAKSSDRQSEVQRTLAARLQSFRKRRGMNLKAVAEALGCSVSNVCRLLQGTIGMSVHHENLIRNLMASDDLTAHKDELVSMIEAMQPKELHAATKILQILQNMRTVGS
jgi:transcriptional regulator with XRE-family HTH domain